MYLLDCSESVVADWINLLCCVQCVVWGGLFGGTGVAGGGCTFFNFGILAG